MISILKLFHQNDSIFTIFIENTSYWQEEVPVGILIHLPFRLFQTERKEEMKHSSTWRSIVSRLLFVFILVVPLGITTSRADIVQASPSPMTVQQADSTIDNSVPGEFIPAAENPSGELAREPGNPDVSLPGSVGVQVVEDVPLETIPEVEQVPNPDAPIDMSLPENVGLSVTPVDVSFQPPNVPEVTDPGVDQTLGIPAPEVLEENGLDSLGGLTGNLEDFNRPNGFLGGAWTDKVAGISITNSHAQTVFGETTAAISIHNGIGVNEAMTRVLSSGSGEVQYAGFAFNYADGQDFIFIKVQDNNDDGLFEYGACYTGNNNLVSFGLGFFALSGSFSAATLHVTVNANRSVVIALTDLAGGGADQKYICNGAPAVNGSKFGIVSFGGGQLEDVTVEAADPDPFTSFADQDGPLGSDWYVQAGDLQIYQQKAVNWASASSLATYNSLGANSVEADISLTPGGGPQFSGLVLNYGVGVDNLFLKVQDNDGNGTFESGACYTGNNGTGFGLSFFALSYPFTRAHLTVSVSNDRVVHFLLTHIDGGSGSQYYECANAPAIEGYGVGIASWHSGKVDNFQVVQDFRDNFNRANGPLGTNWTVRDGNYEIVSQKAKGTSGYARATFNQIGGSRIEADVSLEPGVGAKYSALMLDYGAGANNLFIKVQDNFANNTFTTAGCYIGNNTGGFGEGFFDLDAPFTTAHMIVSVDEARVVTLVFTNINGGSGTQAYVCGVAPAAEGPLAGIASYGGGLVDNVHIDRVFGLDHFNRPTGSLGPSWETRNGVMGLVDQAARGTTMGSSLTLFKNVTGNRVEGNIVANPSGEFNFSAFILNYGTGANNLFIKFQNQNGDNAFESIGCYIGNNSDGFGPGYFSMTSQVIYAHASIWVDSTRTVHILLTRINGGTGMQFYTCAGAPAAEGKLVGIASWNGGRIDNVTASEYVPTLDEYLPVIIR